MRRIFSFPPLGDAGLVELLPGTDVADEQALAHYVRCGRKRLIGGGCDTSQLPANHLGASNSMGDPSSPSSARVCPAAAAERALTAPCAAQVSWTAD